MVWARVRGGHATTDCFPCALPRGSAPFGIVPRAKQGLRLLDASSDSGRKAASDVIRSAAARWSKHCMYRCWLMVRPTF